MDIRPDSKISCAAQISGQNRLKMHSVCTEKTALNKQNASIVTVAQMCVKSTMQHHSVSMSIHVTVPRNNINQTNRNPAFMSVHDLKTHKSTHAHVYILPTGQYWADIWFCGSLTILAVNVFTEMACLHYCRAAFTSEGTLPWGIFPTHNRETAGYLCQMHPWSCYLFVEMPSL